ncbi:hypothetical protein ACOBR2_05650 [Telmatobacter bradus]|jgi:hypothetical protein|uniref:hypothetical protein n=1 Tax=Telmatobacter bradus TaxID=474953 RepID=UPI003B43ABE1
MIVTTQYRGRHIAGLYIGTSNVDRYFSRSAQVVELHLGHLHIQCRLTAQFWDGKPEIEDSRLGEWLKSKHLYDKSFQTPIPVEMVPSGQNTFSLGPLASSLAGSINTTPQTTASA